MTNYCKDCVHFHDTYFELPLHKRLLTFNTQFSDRCDYPEFADEVTGNWIPCVTARINKCDGKTPYFVRKDMK